MTDMEIQHLKANAEALKSIAEAIGAMPPQVLSNETFTAFDKAALSLLNLINVK